MDDNNRTPLSPAAQAVLDAYKEASDGRYIDGEWVQDHAGQVAAALRAAADQVITENRLAALDTECSAPSRLLLIWARDQLLAIAAELEGATPAT